MDARKNKSQYDKVTERRVHPLRVAARLEGVVKNRGTKKRKRPRQDKKKKS